MNINWLEIFGVEDGEVFYLGDEVSSAKYKIQGNVIFIYLSNGWEKSHIGLNDIAGVEVKRLPFVPKPFDKYYTPNIRLEVIKVEFATNTADVFRLEYGLCYRTKEQAEREGIPKMKALIEKWGGKVD